MPDTSTQNPQPGGIDSDNQLLYKIAARLAGVGGVGVTIAAGTDTAGYSSKVSVTRPADTTPYTAGDVVGATAAVWTFTSAGPAAGYINLNDADFRIDVSAVPFESPATCDDAAGVNVAEAE